MSDDSSVQREDDGTGARSVDGTERPTTTEYGVVLTLERGSKFIWARRRMVSWSPKPTSEDGAIEWARERYEDEITEIHEVRTREVPLPEKWTAEDRERYTTDTDR